MELNLLKEIVIILGISVLIILVFQKLKIPSVIGLLFAGIIAGPHGLMLVSAVHEVELLAEIGVIFLLFVIGMEFSLKGLISIRRTVLGGGVIQVGATILAVLALGVWAAGMPLKEALVMGFLLSLSSTAIVLKIIQERGDITSPHGRTTLAILIFQDIIVVPMMLFMPFLAGEGGQSSVALFWLVVKVTGVIGVVILLARYIVPFLLTQVVRTKNRELFILSVVVLCFSTAWMTSVIGLSLALGAFFAGLIVSESDYSHQATASILPFREIFISFFFISIGMLLDLEFLFAHIGLILLLCLAVIVLKTIITAVAVFFLGYPFRTTLLVAFSLFQVGEFAFLLSATGMKYHLLGPDNYQYFLAISILSMAVTPFIMHAAPGIADYLLRALLSGKVKKRLAGIYKMQTASETEEKSWHDHLIIIGYGLNGENVAKAAVQAQIPYVVIELDPDVFRKIKSAGEPAIFGDASDETILRHVCIQKSRVVVIAISDPEATKKMVSRIRQFSKTVYIIVRTRYVREIDENLRLGADEVIPEEFETSIEIFSRVMKKYLVPLDEIHSFIQVIRSGNYGILRNPSALSEKAGTTHLHIPDMDIATLQVQQGDNRIVGKRLQDSGIRTHFGINVLAIKRGNRFITKMLPETEIRQDDILYIFGNPDHIARLNEYLSFSSETY